MEPTEMDEFGKQMREAGENAEASLTHVSLIISVLAVLVAVCTVLGHREHTEAVLMQSRASDQWNEYQARRLRVELNDRIVTLLSLQQGSNTAAVEAKVKQYQAQMEKWKAENDEATKQAKEFEDEVTHAESKAARFDLAEALLEIAVVLASITLLTRHRRYVAAAVVLGLAGIAIGASAFLVH